ncbi:glycoside hydrolase superfamily [Amylocarpus encephaloides]|uniref:Glycoside hydrolase superfamily n=1 Tax=Amylocarpus encephaloides TaxID=45428 RepID=A0A9P8C0Z2_9HELO|nr:glycoside hydrolase superfamily [Amylocarpus encephaloides]
MSVIFAISLLCPAALAAFQNTTGSPTFAQPSGYETKIYNASAASATIKYEYTNEELALLWNQVGEIEVGPITTTVSPTPEPTAYPRPGPFHPLVASSDPSLNSASLPDNFVWGIAASSYQIEGAAKDEGKGPSVWDLIAHRDIGAVADNSTGDVVGSHYYLYKQDFARLAKLGVPYFSPSLSWPRFFPFGNGPLNQEGVAHYDDVIASMVSAGIKPAVTLFHWDTPLALFNSYGAWSDPKIVDDFFNYAKFVITRYDKYVPIWYTFNEPQYCNWQYQYYPSGRLYPSYNNISTGLPARIACSHHTLLAHAKVSKWYHEDFKGTGRITFKNSGNFYEAADPLSPADVDAVARNYEFVLGWFGGCWRDGDYSPMLKKTLGTMLPVLSTEEKEMIKGSCDFFGIDAYTGYIATSIPGGSAACAANSSHPAFPECANSASLGTDGFPLGPAGDNGVSWLYSTPTGIRKFLNVIMKELFPTATDVVVSEFGFAEPFEGEQTSLQTILWDLRRADYYQSFLDNILLARTIDGVNVTGLFAWSIFDNFEWFAGSKVKFGVQYLNYTSMERVPKASMFQFVDWFKGKVGSGENVGNGNGTGMGNWTMSK